MRIVFTKHATRKFKFHRQYGWHFKVKDIKEALYNPDYSRVDKKSGEKFILKKIDSEHDLRVVFGRENDIIRVITFYPTRRGRYE